MIDRLTGLQWEKKTDDAMVHDKDNVYSWSATPFGTAADGTAFKTFLSQLNFPFGCFAGQCDWRLPTVYELQTILSQPYPCSSSPCIDETAFGPTGADTCWSATIEDYPLRAWAVYFVNGGVGTASKDTDGYVRAVRAGL